ncbi:PKD domain-containing protein (plasmid) [Haladaptatus sp. SPP-AMP-3]|uniref:PKD domain-containing protein n=1 Tax=Haladaptatus sp. SPP-AMP-3 TaxID=3121295 RepID=UPI003C2D876F
MSTTTCDYAPHGWTGCGWPSRPYIITNITQLQAVDQEGSYFALGADIDASETANWNGGKGFKPLRSSWSFSGTFDGRGHAISNLTIDRPGEKYVGLFSNVRDGTIENVQLKNASIRGDRVVGGLVAKSHGIVENSSVTGFVSGTDDVAGLVADNRNDGWADTVGTVRNSYSAATLSSSAPSSFPGGLTGWNSNGDVIDSYWDVDASETSKSNGGTGLSTAEMQGPRAYLNMNGFGFGRNWTLTDGYPRLSSSDLVGLPVHVIDDFSAPNHVKAGKTLTVTTTVRNLVDDTDGRSVRLTIDGTPVNQTILSLDEGETKRVGLQYIVPSNDVGTHRVGITTNADTTTTNVDTVATLSGTVTDPSGNVGSAIVSLVGTGTQTTTSWDGSYTLPNINRKSATVHVAWNTPSGTTVTKNVTVTMAGNTVKDVSLVPSLATLPGDGSASHPYVISSVRGLVAIRHSHDAHYVLGSDIDASGTFLWQRGNGFDPLGNYSDPFTGTFDGDGHTISGLTIDRSSEKRVGLFGKIGSGGIVTNVSSVGVDITGDTFVGGLVGTNEGKVAKAFVRGRVTSGGTTGGLVGRVRAGGRVVKSSAQSTVTGIDNTGGLVGELDDGTVSESDATGDVSGRQFVGGLVGLDFNGTITNTYATGDVSGQMFIGGLVGNHASDSGLSNSYATGSVSGKYKVGGVVGTGTAGSATYWNTGTSGQSASAGSTGLTTNEMTGQSAGTKLGGFDFGTMWLLTDGYPRLRWSVSSVSLLTRNHPIATGKTTRASVNIQFVHGSGETGTSIATYGSNDTGVATVSTDGVVSGVGVGTATIAADFAGRHATTVLTVTDGQPPVAVAGTDRTVDEGTAVTFDASTSTDNIGVTSYAWDFGDGSTATGANVSHAYVSAGNYTITLTVGDGAGNTDTDTLVVTVNDVTPPTADAGSNRTVEQDAPVSFDASGSTDNDGIVSYEWTFGDDTTATGTNVSHVYPDPGKYTVTLTVADEAGNLDTDSMRVTVTDVTPPTADVGTNRTVDEDSMVVFNTSGSVDNVGINSVKWAFGDGTNATGANVTHVYAAPGKYTVTLTASDAAGNEGTDAVTVTVSDVTPPNADAGTNQPVNEDSSVTFDGSLSTDNSGIASYNWRFGDGTNATGMNVSHVYADPGKYSVILTVMDGTGNTDTDSVTVTVKDVTKPVAEAGSNRTVNEDARVAFDASDSTDNGVIEGYHWRFGDGTNATGMNVSHAFIDPGNYTVILTVTDSDGNCGTDVLSVVVNDTTTPVADAGGNRSVYSGNRVRFTASNSTDNGNVVRYRWNFSDGTNATGATVVHTFSTSGTYTVTLTVTDADGNVDSDTVRVGVRTRPPSGGNGGSGNGGDSGGNGNGGDSSGNENGGNGQDGSGNRDGDNGSGTTTTTTATTTTTETTATTGTVVTTSSTTEGAGTTATNTSTGSVATTTSRGRTTGTTGTATSSNGQPGFGIVVALLSLFVLLSVIAEKRRLRE